MSIYRLTISLILGASLVLYFFFWVTLTDQREETAKLINASLSTDLSEIAYELTKKTSRLSDINIFKATIDRRAARNDLIKAILVVHGSRILLYTDPAYRSVPKSEITLTELSTASLDTLTDKQAYAMDTQFFDNLKPVPIRIILLLDHTYINLRLSQDINTLLYVQGLPPVLVLVALWMLLNRSISRPLEQLRRYAYDPLTEPAKLHVKELESIRQTLKTTFTRLDDERQELYHRSISDELSGLANRNFLIEELEKVITDSKRYEREIAVLFLDIDNFKTVNDTIGHEAGDDLICMVAEKLREMFRASDIIARIGGDEFVVVIREYNSRSELLQILTRLQNSMGRDWIIQDKEFHLSSSVGVALFPMNGEDAGTLLKNADIAMYEAKKNGKNQFHFFSEALNQVIMEEVSLDRDMRSGLLNNEFEVFYQAKIRVDDDQVTGAEALLRWNHPKKGFIAPAAFLPIAERTGFIIDIGKWVTEQAVKQQIVWKELGFDLNIAINLSPIQFRDNGLFSFINNVITHSGVEARKIDFEITESIFLDNSERNLELLNMIHELGVGISLDDFGTGYASLSSLKTFPIDKLKIDKVFVDDFASTTGATFLETIVTMGRTLNMEVIAEGIEEKAQLDYLKSIQCDTYQGFYCCKPIAARDFLSFMRLKKTGKHHNVFTLKLDR